METKKIVFDKPVSDPWLDEMGEEQYKKLKDVIGATIVITKGFAYDNKSYGRSVCLQYGYDGKVWYSTEFGNAIVRQFEEIIKPVLDEGNSAEVRIIELTSKKYKGTKYIAFDTP